MSPIAMRSRLQVGDYGYGGKMEMEMDDYGGDGGGSAVDLLSSDVCRWVSGMVS